MASPSPSPQNRVLTPVVVCGSPSLRVAREGQLLSPLLTAAAANAAASGRSAMSNLGGGVLLQNNVPASESEKLTTTNIYVLHEIEQPRPRPSDIESTNCPPSVEPFRKAWWAGVRPTTCERTCRHRSKVCDAIQLCNDCTGYYCKWLAELVGIPVLKASGRVDPLLFERDPLAKLYWERISKVACCPKVTAKCLMCIRRYQLFTHFLPGNLDFRNLVHESVMKLHEEGFAVDMGLIRKVTRRHLECIADSMELRLPVEYMSSYHAYDIIVRRGPLVDVLANGLSSALQGRLPSGTENHRPTNSSVHHLPVVVSSNQRSLRDPSLLGRIRSVENMDAYTQAEQAIKQALSKDMQTVTASDSRGEIRLKSEDVDDDENRGDYNTSTPTISDGGDINQTNIVKRRSKRQIKRPPYGGVGDIYCGDDHEFLALLDEAEQRDEEGFDGAEDEEHARKKRRRTTLRRRCSTDLRDVSDVSLDTETFQMLCHSKGGPGIRQATREGMWVPNSAFKGSRILNSTNFNRSLKLGSSDEKLAEETCLLDVGDGSTEAIDRLASILLQRLDSGHRYGLSDEAHREQILEEARLGESGVRGVFWDPSKNGWCCLLPLVPSNEEGLQGMKRKILCFSSSASRSFDSSKWRAVYERLRRNPRELESLAHDVRQDLSDWVRDNIESTGGSETIYNHQSISNIQLLSPNQSGTNRTTGYSTNGDLDLNNPSDSTRVADLLGSLAKHMLKVNEDSKDPGRTLLDEKALITSSVSADDREDTEKLPASILGLLASLQSRLANDQAESPTPILPSGNTFADFEPAETAVESSG